VKFDTRTIFSDVVLWRICNRFERTASFPESDFGGINPFGTTGFNDEYNGSSTYTVSGNMSFGDLFCF